MEDPAITVKTLAEVVREHILQAFEHCGSNRRKTAKALGISESALSKRLKSFGVPSGKSVTTRVEAFLRERGGSWTNAAIAGLVGEDVSSVNAALKRHPQFVRHGSGVWSLRRPETCEKTDK